MAQSLQTQASRLPFSLPLSVVPRTEPAITFRGQPCRLRLGRYSDSGCLRLELLAIGDEGPFATASLELPGIRPTDLVAFAQCRGYEADRLVLIQDWGENEGLLEVLLAAGLLEDTGAIVPTGVVHDRGRARLCRLLVG